jgi:hypothetical protein
LTIARADDLRFEHLTAVLAAPPIRGGNITTNRVVSVATMLGFNLVSIVNVLDVRTTSVADMTQLGRNEDAWVRSRNAIEEAIHRSSQVLLAYGCGAPTGPARAHFRGQIIWLRDLLTSSGVDVVVSVGGRPRHPSRWQRATHATYPGLSFGDALPQVLRSEPPLDFFKRNRVVESEPPKVVSQNPSRQRTG